MSVSLPALKTVTASPTKDFHDLAGALCTVQLSYTGSHKFTSVSLPGSKSDSNRALILQALANGDLSKITNLAIARDTDRMLALLCHEGPIWDAGEAGTTFRFMTALLAVADKRGIIQGSDRMHQRPIKVLVDALTELGAHITYTDQEGYPPLRLNGFSYSGISELSMEASISSQYISAIMMVAPLMPHGLTLFLKGQVTSRPYLELTAEGMRQFGAKVHWYDDQAIRIEPGGYQDAHYVVEPDWSSAGYWYSMLALSKATELFLPNLNLESKQADRAVVSIMQSLGIETKAERNGILLTKDSHWQPVPEPIPIDCTDFPDLAQTLAVAFGAVGQHVLLTGLHTLRIKETDRIQALQNELPKLGLSMEEVSANTFLVSGTLDTRGTAPHIFTYDDHRMALAFAPVAMKRPLSIENPGVVRKSYPNFWNHLQEQGMTLRFT